MVRRPHHGTKVLGTLAEYPLDGNPRRAEVAQRSQVAPSTPRPGTGVYQNLNMSWFHRQTRTNRPRLNRPCDDKQIDESTQGQRPTGKELGLDDLGPPLQLVVDLALRRIDCPAVFAEQAPAQSESAAGIRTFGRIDDKRGKPEVQVGYVF